MIIAVASDDFSTVAGHVGRCAGFLIFNVENGEVLNIEERENSFTNHSLGGHENSMTEHKHQHGKGHRNGDGHKRLVEGLKDCEYLISHGMGKRLVDELKTFGITPLVTNELNAKLAALKLEQGNLEMVDSLICK